jgi:hypothetical protein
VEDIANSDPSNITPRLMPVSQVKTEVLLDSCTRGKSASGYLKELCEYYFRDKIAPGLQSAWLPDKQEYYVAVHRFTTHTIDSRQVVAKATASVLETAESMCMAVWRSIVKQVEESRAKSRTG